MQTQNAEWPIGPGEMARRIRAYDWSSTPLGAIETWPQSLKTVVDLLLASGHAMMLAWGPERTLLYNDAYAPMLGGFHPRAIGLPFRQAWPDIWQEIEPLVERVFAGETVRYEALPLVMQRHGYPEDTWWNFSYSPVRDESGAIAGLLNVTVDATPTVRAERAERERDEANTRFQVEAKRHEFLLTLSDALRPLADAAEIQATTARLLGVHLGVDRAMYAEVEGEPGAERGTIRGQYVRPASGGDVAVAPFPERFTYRPFGAHTMAGRYGGDILVVADVQADSCFDGQERAAWEAAGVRAAIVAPLAKGGRLVAEFGVHSTAPRLWTNAEVWLVREVGERTWAAAERARAEKELRESEERLRLALDAAEMGSFAWYPDEDRTETDPRLLALFGLPPHETISHAKTMAELVHPEDRARNDAALLRALDPNGDGHFQDEFRVVESNAAERWLATTGRVEFAGRPRRAVRLSGVAVDITERKRRETNQRLLVDISEDLNRLSDEEEIIRAVGAKLAAHLNLACYHYVEVNEERAEVTVRYFWHALDVPPILGTYPISRFMTPRGLRAMRAGESTIVNDTQSDIPGDTAASAALKAGAAAQKVGAFVAVPYSQDGKWIAYFAVADSCPRQWTAPEIELIQDVSNRVLPRLHRAAAEHALHESEERYQTLFAASPTPLMVLAPNAPDFTITAANEAYFTATLTTPETLIGRRLFDVFPDDPRRPGQLGSEALAISLDRVLATRQTDFMPRVRYDLVTPNGYEPHWWDAINAPILDSSGTVSAIIHQVHRVTELHHAEQAKRENQARQAFLLALGDAMRGQPTADGVIAAASSLLGERLRASRIMFSEFDHERGIADIFYGWFADGAAPFPAVMRLEEYEGPILEDLRAGRTVRIDNAGDPSLRRPDLAAIAQVGVLALLSVPLHVGGRLLVNLSVHQHVARHWTDDEVALVREVAERLWSDVVRMRAEEALRRSEEQFRRAVEEAPIPVIMHAEDGQVLQISRTWTELTGFQPEDIPTFEAWLNQAYGEGADAVRTHMHELFAGNRRSVDIEFPIRTRTGQQRQWSFSASSPGMLRDGRRFIVGMAVDITERARAEKELRASEERLRQFGEASQDILWIRAADTLQWTYLTPAFETIYGVSREDALSGDNYRSWLDLILPEDRPKVIDAIGRVKAGEHVTFDYRIRRPSDGAIRWLRNTDFPITNAAGEIAWVGGIGHDFTGLREAELRLQTLIEGIPQLVWRAIGDGQWTWASPQWTEYTGQSEPDSRGRGWLETLHPDDRTAAQHAWAHAAETGGFEVEYRLCERATQDYRWFQTRATPVRGQAGDVVEWLGTSTDIHELRELQERQQVLVAELQHRTRNLMSVVRSVADKTASSSADLDDFGERFGDRLDALARVQRLLSRLNEHDRVTFDQLIASEIAALDGSGERVTLTGPAGIRLRSSMVQTLALALHELFTNAIKYGALHQPSGRLAVHWSLEPADGIGPPWLHIDWRETGVTLPRPDSKPERRGQGRELIERALPYQLKARTHYELGPDGVHCTISLPVSQTTESKEFSVA